MVIPEYRHLADIAEHSRTDAALRNGFMKKAGIDFKNEGFNTAFAMKVRRGNL